MSAAMSAAAHRSIAEPTLESHAAPVHVGSVALRVRDLERVAGFYREVIGLGVVAESDGSLTLGNEGVALLSLIEDRQAPAAPQGAPGLFHTAFLLPERRDLGRWLRKAAAEGWRIEGAADHLVSEAVYLSDPEGNGIEIYRDRHRAEWPREGAGVRMANARLDFEGLVALADARPEPGAFGLPPGARIGHIHLSVTDLPAAQAVLEGQWGFDTMCRFPGAGFFATGGYHHHIAANIWSAAGPMRRDARWAGLACVTLQAASLAAYEDLAGRWRKAGGAVSGEGAVSATLEGMPFRLEPPAA